MELKLVRKTSADPDFQYLVKLLDQDLHLRDGEDHSFYAQFNKIDHINHVIVGYVEGQAIACGAIKVYSGRSMEVKRMYVLPSHRGQGYAAVVLKELEAWAWELEADKCVLETGIRQPEAIRLYEKSGYARIPNYGQYAEVATSLCFEKNAEK